MTLVPVSAVVVHTMVVSWLFDERANPLGERYREIIEPARVILSFQSVMELHFGALRAGWGDFQYKSGQWRQTQTSPSSIGCTSNDEIAAQEWSFPRCSLGEINAR